VPVNELVESAAVKVWDPDTVHRVPLLAIVTSG
jgi:hypothetical protein